MIDFKKYKKNILFIVLFFVLGWVFILGSHLVNTNLSSSGTIGMLDDSSQLASLGNYVPLSNLPGLSENEGVNLPFFLKMLYRWGISITVVLSIIYIILGGIQYMTTDSISNKSDGKERIKGALLGLILALSSYLILHTINPQLLDLSIAGRSHIELTE